MGRTAKGIAWGTAASIATIIGVGYTIWDSENKKEKESAAIAAKVPQEPAAIATPTAAVTCTITGTIVDQYSRRPLRELNVVVFKRNSTCDHGANGVAVSISTEPDGSFRWKGPCSEINGQPILVSLGATNFCLMPSGWSVAKDVEASFPIAVDSALLDMPGWCQPCPTREMR
ncbi:MAG TPA: hypothetical protein VK636_05280 [Gemmatimonadaceae bacterium]|nr:hypothetical protein [Gemmatimonadaceae bacterium]